MYIATRNQMKQVDKHLLKTYSIIELVDKASTALFQEIKEYSSFLICCGPGNNGADGYSLALKLHQIHKKVRVFSCQTHHLSEACKYYCEKCVEKGLVISELDESISYEIIIDGLFGFGLHSSPSGSYEKVIQFINQSNSKVISIDVPSGLDCNTGNAYENCVKADYTYTFFALKQGFLNPESKIMTGNIKVLTLDVQDDSYVYFLSESVDDIKIKSRKYDDHKGKYGKAYLICGSDSYRGAAILSASACVYSGCGITCLNANDNVSQVVVSNCPEVILNKREEFENCLNYDAVLIGCGLNEENDELLEFVLKNVSSPLVIDASGLTILSKHLDWLENHHQPVVLTPHIGEFKRLCSDSDDLIESAIQFAHKYSVTLVLKGPHTLITDGEYSYRNMSGNPSMAIGGSGDVLAGMIVSFLAQHYDRLEATKMAVYLHGKIADEIAVNSYTVLPSKLVEMIPLMMRKYVK